MKKFLFIVLLMITVCGNAQKDSNSGQILMLDVGHKYKVRLDFKKWKAFWNKGTTFSTIVQNGGSKTESIYQESENGVITGTFTLYRYTSSDINEPVGSYVRAKDGKEYYLYDIK